MSISQESQQGGLRKALIVGCGGSGDATLAFMMDQLRSILAREGIMRLPRGWQFVEVDVPISSERRKGGLPNVKQAGGIYVGLGLRDGHYATLDSGVTERLASKGALQELATWAPRDPQDPALPGVTDGAGQVRAVGRMVTLNGANRVKEAVRAAVVAMNSPEANRDMDGLTAFGGHDQGSAPLVIVVSSMAGGAGASMALDVCRILSREGLSHENIAVFMVGADVFNEVPEHARSGVRANALAKLGEIVACQAGAGVEDDQRLYDALEGEGARDAFGPIPFKRVFPIGASIATANGTARFGDGKMSTIYRGLGVGLASLLTSVDALEQFIRYDFANKAGMPGDAAAFGWGTDQSSLEWGSFGFASLSMGRDRYAEYSAQCLARGAVNRLVGGHIQPTSTAQPQEQAEALVSQLFTRFLADLHLWDPSTSWEEWLQQELWPAHENREYSAPAAGTASAIVDDEFGRYLPDGDGMRGNDWSSQVRRLLGDRSPQLEAGTRTASHRFIHSYHQVLFSNFVREVDQSISRHGLVYVSTLLQRLQSYLTQLSQEAGKFTAGGGGAGVGTLSQSTESALGGKGVMSNTSVLRDRILNDVRNSLWNRLMLSTAGSLESLIPEFSKGVVLRMQQEVENRLRLVREEMGGTVMSTGLAYAVHDHYAAWPERGGDVPARFTQADNEILLTSASDYPAAFSANLRGAFGGTTVMTEYDAATKAETAIISGRWEPSGGVQSPGGLIELLHRWVPGALGVDPHTGEPLVSADATFRVAANVAELGGRARRFVERPGATFDTFCQESLRAFVTATGLPEHELANRRRRMADAFSATLQRALPLSQPNRALVQEIYRKQPGYLFKFSAIPFKGEGQVTQTMREIISNGVLSGQTDLGNVLENFEESLSSNSNIRSINVFGSYPCLIPICFQSVLDPIAEQWSASATDNARRAFWYYRRARPLTGSLPMGTAERHAMIQGWYLGQITGLIRVPQPPYMGDPGPVRIWDLERSQWATFPHPMLTPRVRLVQEIDWLPAVLESSLIAMAQSGAKPVMSSMRPYQLLRELSGLDDQAKMPGDFITPGLRAIWGWIFQDAALPTGSTRVPSGLSLETPEERVSAALTYCDQVDQTIRAGFLTDPPWSMGRQVANYFRVGDRKVAGAMPLMRDLAEDIVDTAVPCVRQLIETALALGPNPFAQDRVGAQSAGNQGHATKPLGDDGPEVMTFGML